MNVWRSSVGSGIWLAVKYFNWAILFVRRIKTVIALHWSTPDGCGGFQAHSLHDKINNIGHNSDVLEDTAFDEIRIAFAAGAWVYFHSGNDLWCSCAGSAERGALLLHSHNGCLEVLTCRLCNFIATTHAIAIFIRLTSESAQCHSEQIFASVLEF